MTVDIARRLDVVGLGGLPQCCWPSTALVNDLATKILAMTRANVAKPFVYVRLVEWLPQYAQMSKSIQDGRNNIIGTLYDVWLSCCCQLIPMKRAVCASLQKQSGEKQSQSNRLSPHSCGAWHWTCKLPFVLVALSVYFLVAQVSPRSSLDRAAHHGGEYRPQGRFHFPLQLSSVLFTFAVMPQGHLPESCNTTAVTTPQTMVCSS